MEGSSKMIYALVEEALLSGLMVALTSGGAINILTFCLQMTPWYLARQV
jgi:hypothetical protein